MTVESALLADLAKLEALTNQVLARAHLEGLSLEIDPEPGPVPVWRWCLVRRTYPSSALSETVGCA